MAQDVYRDTHSRYLNDPEFYAAVRMLERVARVHGFTPGELKQIAFKAALNIEEARPLLILHREQGELAGHLKDGTPVYQGKAP